MTLPETDTLFDDFPVDIFGQIPSLNIYTQICLCYSIDSDTDEESIISTLKDGLQRLKEKFPWTAGQVVNESGVFRIRPLEGVSQLLVKDLRNDSAAPTAPTMESLRESEFPIHMLDESLIAPRRTLPGHPDEASLTERPVFMVQANFISGGLLLTFIGQHNAMDMIGQERIVSLFSKACHNETFSSDELNIGNLHRSGNIQLIDAPLETLPYNSLSTSTRLTSETASKDTSWGDESTNNKDSKDGPTSCSWALIKFSANALANLKAIANNDKTTEFISTDDVLTAFTWQGIIRARLNNRLETSRTVKLARAIDVREYVGLPAKYPGIVQNMSIHSLTLQEISDEPLGVVASNLRAVLDPKTSHLGYDTRAIATVLTRAPDKFVSFASSLDLKTDIMLSSWAKVNFFNLDFNLGLGKPESIRRPQFTPVESLIYFLPKSPEGDIVICLCLADADLEKLQSDPLFAKYGHYIGKRG
ncbi:Ayt1p [Sugiyamaella lignohabitans]|uniref:Ayt1p n=1 Tax=Sugiyamaella lignohabitans TaxID=796027 RepID=A0A167EMJ1_9ASCO|nr:Ayt1p [Sugiyamaella lignohabitans]ANB14255.1 Ayt1p [Sugiyamaella lignohabitans]